MMVIEDAGPNVSLSQLPKLDGRCFDQVCIDLLQRNKFSVTCLEIVTKLCLDENKYGNMMKGRLCELAIKVCSENNVQVVKKKPSGPQTSKATSSESESTYLSC